MKIIKNLLLTIIAVILFVVMFIAAMIWSLLDLITGRKTLFWRGLIFGLNYLLWMIALTLDRTGAVIGARIWNAVFLTKESELRFGATNENGEPYSISYILGENYVSDSLTGFGFWFKEFLDLFERDHVLKTIKKEE